MLDYVRCNYANPSIVFLRIIEVLDNTFNISIDLPFLGSISRFWFRFNAVFLPHCPSTACQQRGWHVCELRVSIRSWRGSATRNGYRRLVCWSQRQWRLCSP